MDGEAFDRLSMVVHRLRDQATRREAVRTLAAGGIAGLLAGLAAKDASAACVSRRQRCARDRECCGNPDRNIVCDPLPSSCDRSGERCCGRHDARCSSRCDCCQGFTCSSSGRCQSSDDGGESCGGAICERDWTCCRIGGVSRCIDPDNLRCCRSSICERGGDCCGSSCCSSGWKCCGDGHCCPKDWRCGRTGCDAPRTAGISAESAETVPFADPVKGDERKWIEKGWMTAARTE